MGFYGFCLYAYIPYHTIHTIHTYGILWINHAKSHYITLITPYSQVAVVFILLVVFIIFSTFIPLLKIHFKIVKISSLKTRYNNTCSKNQNFRKYGPIPKWSKNQTFKFMKHLRRCTKRTWNMKTTVGVCFNVSNASRA